MKRLGLLPSKTFFQSPRNFSLISCFGLLRQAFLPSSRNAAGRVRALLLSVGDETDERRRALVGDRIEVPLELADFEVVSTVLVDGWLQVEVDSTFPAACFHCGSVDVVGHGCHIRKIHDRVVAIRQF